MHKYISEVEDQTKGYRYGPVEKIETKKLKPNREEIIPKIEENKNNISITRNLFMSPYGLLEDNSNLNDAESAAKKIRIAKLLKSNHNLANLDNASQSAEETGEELDLKAEPDNDFTLDPVKDIEFGFEKPKFRQSTASTTSTSTPAAVAGASTSTGNNYSKKKTPEWQKNLAPDEVNRISAFASLPPSSLFDKVKEIQNFSFQIGLDEQREMMRAKVLGVFSPDGLTIIDGCSAHKMANDQAYHFIGENLGGFPSPANEVNECEDDEKANDGTARNVQVENVLPLVKRKTIQYNNTGFI